MKKISVIVNCHNGEKYLSVCILSIINYDKKNKKLNINLEDEIIEKTLV
jgi:glycosyltransferase involved in cell wall biosynthesis